METDERVEIILVDKEACRALFLFEGDQIDAWRVMIAHSRLQVLLLLNRHFRQIDAKIPWKELLVLPWSNRNQGLVEIFGLTGSALISAMYDVHRWQIERRLPEDHGHHPRFINAIGDHDMRAVTLGWVDANGQHHFGIYFSELQLFRSINDRISRENLALISSAITEASLPQGAERPPIEFGHAFSVCANLRAEENGFALFRIDPAYWDQDDV